MRTGIGFDIHRFVDGRDFILGGLHIPFEKGLSGHSDGDVLLHALADAILGAMGKPDIGYFFPPDDKNIEGIDSRKIIKKVLRIMREEGYFIENIDIVVICERPKLLSFAEEIKKNLAETLGIGIERIGFKAKTYEGLGDIGSGDACACFVSTLIEREIVDALG
ncbi:MAG TPA: 2-C-methyl-D-erythritol 2,4-cyclodiphosphate synthase [bacterium]|nr:2-C-methyl-D-erythritol 2,4-cyclodiphosphate synthase [bacterium]HPP30072.1 2-C-methyl-D-erythritol 2,4-cyclodiphosphate synthase [bacterium]